MNKAKVKIKEITLNKKISGIEKLIHTEKGKSRKNIKKGKKIIIKRNRRKNVTIKILNFRRENLKKVKVGTIAMTIKIKDISIRRNIIAIIVTDKIRKNFIININLSIIRKIIGKITKEEIITVNIVIKVIIQVK